MTLRGDRHFHESVRVYTRILALWAWDGHLLLWQAPRVAHREAVGQTNTSAGSTTWDFQGRARVSLEKSIFLC